MTYLYEGLDPILRILVVGTLSYLSLLVVVRIAGQRPLGRMQSFDLIVAVAIGSTFGRLLTAQEVQLAEALTAILLLVSLHFVVSLVSYRFPKVASLLETKPVLLYYQGQFQHDMMRHHRITEAELRAAVRRSGNTSLQDVQAVILESDGIFAVLKKDGIDDSALVGVLRR